MPATVLRIFTGAFGSNNLCDSNVDSKVDAGDLSCTALKIFNGPGGC